MQFTGSRYIVAGVTLLIAYIALTSQIFVFIPWLWTISFARMLQVLIPFNMGVGFIYWNYYLACTTDPGTTPVGWGVPREEGDHGKTEDKDHSASTGTGTGSKAIDPVAGHSTAVDHTKDQHVAHLKQKNLDNNNNSSSNNSQSLPSSSGTTDGVKKMNKKKRGDAPLPRYCRTCEAFKPPRSHHCRICKRCVLKMDHHCPWINNCVGHYNYGHFIRFISWVTLTTGACMILLVWRVVDVVQNEMHYIYTGTGPTKTQVIFMAVNIAVDGGVLLAVGILTIYHLWSMITNTSTIEVWEQEKVEAMIKKGKIRKVKFPYNVGCLRNYRQVLGPSALFWLWPQRMLGSGTEFDVIKDKDAALTWPPREYQTSKKQDRTFVSEYTSSAIHHRRHQPKKSIRSSTEAIRGNGYKKNKSRESRVTERAPPHFPTHVRRGSEGWIVQDLTVQQRADLYDRQLQYEREHGGQEEERQSDDEEYQEGLSDIETNTYGGLPGGMQGNHDNYDYSDNDDGENEDANEEEEEEEEDDLPYDVASDEYDDDYGGEYDDEYQGEDEDMDELNPYLAYDEGDESENIEETGEMEDDEVALHGQDRHKIGRFFDHLNSPSGSGPNYNADNDSDDWDEGEGVDVGCMPPTSMSQPDPNKKTFYTMLVEREEALKKQKADEANK